MLNTEPIRNVLLVEDDPATLMIARKILEQKGYTVETADNGKTALEKFNTGSFPVVITDIYMPEIGGIELIERLSQTGEDPVVVVISSEKDISIVLDIMRRGVYDYIVKPLNRDDFVFKIDKAFELAKYRNLCRDVMQEREILHTSKTDWNSWKEAILRRNNEKIDLNLFHNLKTSFSQSAGFGGLLSIIPFIPMQAKKIDGFYQVPEEIIDLLLKNSDAARKTFEKFDEISNAISKNYQMKPVSLLDLWNLVNETAVGLEPVTAIKNQRIRLSDYKEGARERMVAIEPDYLKSSIQELMINACKFSEENTTIKILFDQLQDKFHISFINSPTQNKFSSRGIPQGYEKLIFEPFFRLHGSVDERFETLDFGIGLTMAERIIRKMNGSIIVRNLLDHSDLSKPKELKVNFDIQLPLLP